MSLTSFEAESVSDMFKRRAKTRALREDVPRDPPPPPATPVVEPPLKLIAAAEPRKPDPAENESARWGADPTNPTVELSTMGEDAKCRRLLQFFSAGRERDGAGRSRTR